MRVGTWGRFVITARAAQQGTRWVGEFKIRRTDESLFTTVDFQDTTRSDATFESREEAEDAAFSEGLNAAKYVSAG
jgi:hypothetical protein